MTTPTDKSEVSITKPMSESEINSVFNENVALAWGEDRKQIARLQSQITDLLARVKELEAENQSIMERFRQLVKTNENRYTALNAAREALEKWKAYFQANIPNNADQMEEQGEQFTEAWHAADHALSQIQACEVKS